MQGLSAVTRKCFISALGLLFVAVCTTLFAEVKPVLNDEVSALLSRMSVAIRNSNYQGRFVYIMGNDTSSFELQHALINNKEYERLVFLNKKEQEVVRIGHDVYCSHTGNELLREHKQSTGNPFSDKSKALGKGLFNNYAIKVVKEGERVAGRDAYKIKFIAKDKNRFNHVLWIDKASNLLLKSEVRDPMVGSLETFEYVQLETDVDIPESEFGHKDYIRHTPKHFPPHEAKANKHEDLEPKLVKYAHDSERKQWQVSWLPEGFYFSGQSREVLEDNKSVTMLMFADGLAAITVFIEAVEDAGTFSESSQTGALSTYSQALSINGENFMITAVGDVQLTTLERITKALRLATK